MADYIKTTDFAAKDALPTGTPAKVAKGSEVDFELEAIETASGTKIDKVISPTAGNAVTLTATGGVADAGFVPASADVLSSLFPNVAAATSVTETQLDFLLASGLTAADLQKLADTNASAGELNDLAGNAVDAADFTKLSQIASSAAAIDAAVTAANPPAAAGYNIGQTVYQRSAFPSDFPFISIDSGGIGTGSFGVNAITIANIPSAATCDVEFKMEYSAATDAAETECRLGTSGGGRVTTFSISVGASGGDVVITPVIQGVTSSFDAEIFGIASAAGGTVTLSYRVLRAYI